MNQEVDFKDWQMTMNDADCRIENVGDGTALACRPPGLPCPPTPVGPERCDATGIPSPPI